MNIQTDIERPPATLPGTAPVAMQHGRRGDRIVLARLRAERSWLVRARDKAGLVPDPPRPKRATSPASPSPRRPALATDMVVALLTAHIGNGV